MMSRKIFTLALSATMMSAMAVSPAFAGKKEDIENLQSRMGVVEKSVTAQTQANIRIGELEREIQLLTGKIEQLSYQLEQSNQRMTAITAALAGGDAPVAAGPLLDGAVEGAAGSPVNLTAGSANVAQGAQATGDTAGTIGGGDVALPLDPNAAFDYSSGFLLSGDYQRAKAAFQLFVEAFPNHARTADAQFRLGEIHLALGENAAAADAFIKHIRDFPNDPRAAESYLKLGTSFARLEKAKEACTVFKTMKKKYPNMAAPVRQRADLEMARIDCQ